MRCSVCFLVLVSCDVALAIRRRRSARMTQRASAYAGTSTPHLPLSSATAASHPTPIAGSRASTDRRASTTGNRAIPWPRRASRQPWIVEAAPSGVCRPVGSSVAGGSALPRRRPTGVRIRPAQPDGLLAVTSVRNTDNPVVAPSHRCTRESTAVAGVTDRLICALAPCSCPKALPPARRPQPSARRKRPRSGASWRSPWSRLLTHTGTTTSKTLMPRRAAAKTVRVRTAQNPGMVAQRTSWRG